MDGKNPAHLLLEKMVDEQALFSYTLLLVHDLPR
jgi:hypothetical protein